MKKWCVQASQESLDQEYSGWEKEKTQEADQLKAWLLLLLLRDWAEVQASEVEDQDQDEDQAEDQAEEKEMDV